MPGAATPDSAPPRRSGAWIVTMLVVLGLLPFVVSLAVVVYVRRHAADDPNAQRWIDENAGASKLLGSRAK